jgi:VWFA-related protein
MRYWTLVLALATPAFCQDVVEDPGVVIRSTTSLVQVRVVASDSKGKPVLNLQSSDFQILDDHKLQPITLFRVEGRAQSQPGAVDRPRAGRKEEHVPSGYALIVLDWLNTPYFDRLRAQEHVLHLLKEYEPSQRVGVYLLGQSPRLIHDFTSDRDELIAGIEEAGLEPSAMDETKAAALFDASAGGRAGPRPNIAEQMFFLNMRVKNSFQFLDLIAERLVHVPGRKSLIWLSNAFPTRIRGNMIAGASEADISYLAETERLLAKLNRADVAVYPVDASGLATTSRSFVETMREFADRTGGIAFYARNDLHEGIRSAMEDSRNGYTLGFQVPAAALPGVHVLRVKVNRPGVTLRHRESYQLETDKGR